MRRPWSFARRITVGFIASLVVALAIAAVTVLAVRSVFTDNEQLTQGRAEHVVAAEQLRRFYSEKLAAHRGHELTSNDFFLVQAIIARKNFQTVLEDLRSHAAGDEEARTLAAVAEAERQHQEIQERLMEAHKQGVSRQMAHALFLQVAEARERTEEALARLSWLTVHRQEMGTALEDETDRRALVLILVVATLGLLVAMGLAWVLTRALWPLHQGALATEERFRLLVEGVKDYALYLLDPQGRVASWNPGAERIQGWPAEAIIGQPGARLYPEEEVARGEPQRELERAAREGRLLTEGWRVGGDGKRFWAETLLTALHTGSGRLKGYAVLTRDITERNRTERAQRILAEVERLFHTEEDPDRVVVALAKRLVPELADGTLLFLASPSGESHARAVAHVSEEKERLMWELIRYAPEREWRGSSKDVLRRGETERVAEVTPELMEGTALDEEHLRLFRALDVRSYLSVPLRVGGRTLGVFILLSGRPELRFSQADQVFIEELASRAALALDNARLLREAQGALELIGVASHDLGNPLNNLHLLLGKLTRSPPADEDKLREGLTAALRQTQRLGRLLHNLLDLSRLSSGKLELEVVEVDLVELVREGVARHADEAEEAGSRVELEVGGAVVGRWDRLRLERVLTNLLSNAFKYGKGQPIHVRVEPGQEGQARLVVRDEGPGIPPEEQASIFERFKKATSSRGKKEGFGLGLYIVRQLVEAHGGSIRVRSAVGAGATFTVELPLVPVSREVDAAEAAPGLVH
ncbi:ATP-binding protein [Archangium sp.]|uniref:sensor histidine kinase n=1 Tax=Archangium sp. TaxID=1872627 RepID=UPI00286A0DC3|nr:ATP-binding protein [Archangium sp.]